MGQLHCPIYVACMVLLCLAPLPDDLLLTRSVLLANSLTAAIHLCWDVLVSRADVADIRAHGCRYEDATVGTAYCWTAFAVHIAYMLINAVFICGALLAASFGVSAKSMQARMWNLIALYLALMLLTGLTCGCLE